VNDPYQEARSIADSLDGIGLHEYAVQLRGALVEGATGTEIYMNLRWRLANMVDDKDVAAEVKTRIRLLHGYLDRALKSHMF
jgi:hypothetical protein